MSLSSKHIKECHGIELPEPIELVSMINKELQNMKASLKKKRMKFKRMKVLEMVNEMCNNYLRQVKTLAWEKCKLRLCRMNSVID